ncbi:MAG: hypothetical protein GY931_19580 [Maribacter sp.]|nr:hypothetical protein [Maribacter sp.]
MINNDNEQDGGHGKILKDMRNKFLIWKNQRDMENRVQKEKKSKNELRELLYDKYVRHPGNYLKRMENWDGDINTNPKICLDQISNRKLTEIEILILKINRAKDMCYGFSKMWGEQKKEIEQWEKQFKLKINEVQVSKNGRPCVIYSENSSCDVTDDEIYVPCTQCGEETGGDPCHYHIVEKDKTGKIDKLQRWETTKVEKDDHYSKRRTTFCGEASCQKKLLCKTEIMPTEPNADRALNTVFKILTDFSETTQNPNWVFDPKVVVTELSKIWHCVAPLLADVINRQNMVTQHTSVGMETLEKHENPTTRPTEPNADRALNTVYKILTDFSETTQNPKFVFDPKVFVTELSKIWHCVAPSLADVINRQNMVTQHTSSEINVTLNFQESRKESPDTHPRESILYQAKTNRDYDFNKEEREIAEKEKPNRETQKHIMTLGQGDRQIIVEPRDLNKEEREISEKEKPN